MKLALTALTVAATMFASSASAADPDDLQKLNDPIKPLFEKLLDLDQSEFEGFSGYLFKGWLQFDEDNPTYSLYINGFKYGVKLDDGRGTSRKANECPEENIFDEDPRTGCAINFDGEYKVERSGSSIEVKTKIWNVEFVE